jgi:hypothetical protein
MEKAINCMENPLKGNSPPDALSVSNEKWCSYRELFPGVFLPLRQAGMSEFVFDMNNIAC